jgi:hypothetical protein
MTESFMAKFVWDQATLDKLPWKDSALVLPNAFIDFMIVERQRQAKIVDRFNDSRKHKKPKFNHQLWMRTIRKKFTSAVAVRMSTVKTLYLK